MASVSSSSSGPGPPVDVNPVATMLTQAQLTALRGSPLALNVRAVVCICMDGSATNAWELRPKEPFPIPLNVTYHVVYLVSDNTGIALDSDRSRWQLWQNEHRLSPNATLHRLHPHVLDERVPADVAALAKSGEVAVSFSKADYAADGLSAKYSLPSGPAEIFLRYTDQSSNDRWGNASDYEISFHPKDPAKSPHDAESLRDAHTALPLASSASASAGSSSGKPGGTDNGKDKPAKKANQSRKPAASLKEDRQPRRGCSKYDPPPPVLKMLQAALWPWRLMGSQYGAANPGRDGGGGDHAAVGSNSSSHQQAPTHPSAGAGAGGSRDRGPEDEFGGRPVPPDGCGAFVEVPEIEECTAAEALAAGLGYCRVADSLHHTWPVVKDTPGGLHDAPQVNCFMVPLKRVDGSTTTHLLVVASGGDPALGYLTTSPRAVSYRPAVAWTLQGALPSSLLPSDGITEDNVHLYAADYVRGGPILAHKDLEDANGTVRKFEYGPLEPHGNVWKQVPNDGIKIEAAPAEASSSSASASSSSSSGATMPAMTTISITSKLHDSPGSQPLQASGDTLYHSILHVTTPGGPDYDTVTFFSLPWVLFAKLNVRLTAAKALAATQQAIRNAIDVDGHGHPRVLSMHNAVVKAVQRLAAARDTGSSSASTTTSSSRNSNRRRRARAASSPSSAASTAAPSSSAPAATAAPSQLHDGRGRSKRRKTHPGNSGADAENSNAGDGDGGFEEQEQDYDALQYGADVSDAARQAPSGAAAGVPAIPYSGCKRKRSGTGASAGVSQLGGRGMTAPSSSAAAASASAAPSDSALDDYDADDAGAGAPAAATTSLAPAVRYSQSAVPGMSHLGAPGSAAAAATGAAYSAPPTSSPSASAFGWPPPPPSLAELIGQIPSASHGPNPGVLTSSALASDVDAGVHLHQRSTRQTPWSDDDGDDEDSGLGPYPNMIHLPPAPASRAGVGTTSLSTAGHTGRGAAAAPEGPAAGMGIDDQIVANARSTNTSRSSTPPFSYGTAPAATTATIAATAPMLHPAQAALTHPYVAQQLLPHQQYYPPTNDQSQIGLFQSSHST